MIRTILLLLGLALTLARPVAAQDSNFIINLRGADISVLAEQVSEITGRTLVLDPALSGDVTVVSAERLDRDGVWELFQSILRVRGYVAVRSGTAWQVVPEEEARTISGATDTFATGSQDFVTEMLRLERLPAMEAMRVLRPLVADSGYLEAITDPNAIIVTDTRSNVDRILAIARAFDQETQEEAQVIRFAYADAGTVGSAILEVLGTSGTGAQLSVDPSSNTLLVRGTADEISEIRLLAQSLDIAPRQPPQAAIMTTVFNLQYAEAAVIAEIIRSSLGDATQVTNAVAADVGAAVPEGEEGAAGFVPNDRSAPAPAVTVQASPDTNSIIVRGTQAQVQEIGQLIHALDVRRPQVMIEAAIVEVSGDAAARLGVQLGFGAATPPGGLAATSFGNGGLSLQNVLSAVGAPASVALTTGLNVAASRNDFGIIIQALSQSTQARLLSTPSVTTLDNEPATIVVGQNVPFRTGSYATDGNTTTPFTTIERRDVGITMSVVPRITAGGVVELQIEQEVSSLVGAVAGAADLITNTRVINTTVLADNGGVVVLGGLITDDQINQESRVPGLGDVPVIGNLFRSRNGQNTQRTLFVFMRPTILRDRDDIRAAAEQRYDRLRAADASEPPRATMDPQEVRRLPLEIQGLY